MITLHNVVGLGESFGVVSLVFAADSVRFPVSKERLLSAVGDRKILWRRDQVIPLDEAIEASGLDVFETFGDLLAAVSHYPGGGTGIRRLTEFL